MLTTPCWKGGSPIGSNGIVMGLYESNEVLCPQGNEGRERGIDD
jgi:hypothetical protein